MPTPVTPPSSSPSGLVFKNLLKQITRKLTGQKQQTLLDIFTPEELDQFTPEFRQAMGRVQWEPERPDNPNAVADYIALSMIPNYDKTMLFSIPASVYPGIARVQPGPMQSISARHEGLHAWDALQNYAPTQAPFPAKVRADMYKRYWGTNPKYTMENHIPSFEVYATAGMNGPAEIPPEIADRYKGVYRKQRLTAPRQMSVPSSKKATRA